MPKKKRGAAEINASSMADIAFLLLVFFLVTTTIASDKGIPILLPPPPSDQDVEINDRNVFKIIMNSNDDLLVEDEEFDVRNLKDDIYEFLTNNGSNPELSDSPKDAVVSVKADRGTSYEFYITVMDQVYAAYYTARARTVGLSIPEYRELLSTRETELSTADKERLDKAKKAFPLQVSEAEPTDIGG